jgi:hypothetical protein
VFYKKQNDDINGWGIKSLILGLHVAATSACIFADQKPVSQKAGDMVSKVSKKKEYGWMLKNSKALKIKLHWSHTMMSLF